MPLRDESKEALLTLILIIFCVWVGFFMGYSTYEMKAEAEMALVFETLSLCPEHTKLVAEGYEDIVARWDTVAKDAVYLWQVCEIAP